MAWPTTKDPRDSIVTLRLTSGEVRELEQLIQLTGARSRSEAIRGAVSRIVAQETRRQGKQKHKERK